MLLLKIGKLLLELVLRLGQFSSCFHRRCLTVLGCRLEICRELVLGSGQLLDLLGMILVMLGSRVGVLVVRSGAVVLMPMLDGVALSRCGIGLLRRSLGQSLDLLFALEQHRVFLRDLVILFFQVGRQLGIRRARSPGALGNRPQDIDLLLEHLDALVLLFDLALESTGEVGFGLLVQLLGFLELRLALLRHPLLSLEHFFKLCVLLLQLAILFHAVLEHLLRVFQLVGVQLAPGGHLRKVLRSELAGRHLCCCGL